MNRRLKALVAVCVAAALLALTAASVFLIVKRAAPKKSYAVSATAPVPDTLAARLDRICGAYGAVGVQAAMVHGETVRFYQYGYADREAGLAVSVETKYRVASLSKLVTDMVFLAMEEDGLVRRTADIGDYLGYPVRNPLFPDVPITPEMLMCHISSLRDSEAFLASRQQGSAEPLPSLLSREDSFEDTVPGQAYSYSNFGLAVLGAVCEKAANTPFAELARRYVFSVLEIDAAYTARDLRSPWDVGVLYGTEPLTAEKQLAEAFSPVLGQTHHLVQGNLTVSALDYARVLYALLHGGVGQNGVRVLQPRTVSEIFSPHFAADGEGIGYGLRILRGAVGSGEQLVHTGSNFGMLSAFIIWPERGAAVVVLTSGARNDTDPGTDIYSVCLDLANEIRAWPFEP